MWNKMPKGWDYFGDMNVIHGALAIKLDRSFGSAKIVEGLDWESATGEGGGQYFMETGYVMLTPCRLRDRQRLRSAMQTVGLTMADLIRDFPANRDMRIKELARALWIYGYADKDNDMIRYEAFEAERETDVDGEDGLEAYFLSCLD